MLTRTQIQRLAQKNRIGMQMQERDYLQHLILSLLYARSQSLVFKGGTALRLVYRGNRYSEDLDFNGAADIASIQNLWRDVIAEMENFGIRAEVRNPWESEVGYSFDVSYHGPLYDGHDHSKGKVRVDINRRPESVDTRRELVTSEYDDVRPFVVTVLTPSHLLAEKLRALLMRSKPRDLYDVWLLLGQGVKPERALIDQKLALYSETLTKEALDAALTRTKQDWDRDLRPLLPQFVTIEDVAPAIQSLYALI